MPTKDVPSIYTDDAQELTTRQRAPFGLWAVIVLHLIIALGNLLVVGLYLSGNSAIDTYMQIALWEPSQMQLLAFTSALLAVFHLLAGVGLWRRRRWAWILTMVLLAYSMTYDIVIFLNGQPSYLSMALNVIQVAYLNQHEVQNLFGEPTTSGATTKGASWTT